MHKGTYKNSNLRPKAEEVLWATRIRPIMGDRDQDRQPSRDFSLANLQVLSLVYTKQLLHFPKIPRDFNDFWIEMWIFTFVVCTVTFLIHYTLHMIRHILLNQYQGHKQDGFSVSEGWKPNTFVKDVSSLLKEGLIFVRTGEGWVCLKGRGKQKQLMNLL